MPSLPTGSTSLRTHKISQDGDKPPRDLGDPSRSHNVVGDANIPAVIERPSASAAPTLLIYKLEDAGERMDLRRRREYIARLSNESLLDGACGARVLYPLLRSLGYGKDVYE